MKKIIAALAFSFVFLFSTQSVLATYTYVDSFEFFSDVPQTIYTGENTTVKWPVFNDYTSASANLKVKLQVFRANADPKPSNVIKTLQTCDTLGQCVASFPYTNHNHNFYFSDDAFTKKGVFDPGQYVILLSPVGSTTLPTHLSAPFTLSNTPSIEIKSPADTTSELNVNSLPNPTVVFLKHSIIGGHFQVQFISDDPTHSSALFDVSNTVAKQAVVDLTNKLSDLHDGDYILQVSLVGQSTVSAARKRIHITNSDLSASGIIAGSLPVGAIELVTCTAQNVATVKGWACDADKFSQALKLDIRNDDGNALFYPLLSANIARPGESATSTQCGGVLNRGFKATFKTTVGAHNVKVNVLDVNNQGLPSGKNATLNLSYTCPSTKASIVGSSTDPVIQSFSIAGKNVTTAKGGDVVTVTGKNFPIDQNFTFNFGASPSQVTSTNGTSFTFTVPSGINGVYDITVVSALGVKSKVKKFTVRKTNIIAASTFPVIQNFSIGGKVSIGGKSGETVTVNGKNFTDPLSIHFGTTTVISGSDNITDVSSTSLKFSVPAVSKGMYAVTVSSGATTSKPKNFRVVEPKVAVAVANANPPVGKIIGKSGTGRDQHITGWACDQDKSDKSVLVDLIEVTSSGTFVKVIKKTPTKDLGYTGHDTAACVGTKHDFDIKISGAAKGKYVLVQVENVNTKGIHDGSPVILTDIPPVLMTLETTNGNQSMLAQVSAGFSFIYESFLDLFR